MCVCKRVMCYECDGVCITFYAEAINGQDCVWGDNFFSGLQEENLPTGACRGFDFWVQFYVRSGSKGCLTFSKNVYYESKKLNNFVKDFPSLVSIPANPSLFLLFNGLLTSLFQII